MHEPAKYQGHYDKGEQGVDGTSDAMQMVRYKLTIIIIIFCVWRRR